MTFAAARPPADLNPMRPPELHPGHILSCVTTGDVARELERIAGREEWAVQDREILPDGLKLGLLRAAAPQPELEDGLAEAIEQYMDGSRAVKTIRSAARLERRGRKSGNWPGNWAYPAGPRNWNAGKGWSGSEKTSRTG